MKKLYTIYNNAYIMLSKYRELKVASPLLTYEAFANELNYNGYITIAASCGADNIRGELHNYTVLIAQDSDYASKSGDFKTILNKILAPEIKALTAQSLQDKLPQEKALNAQPLQETPLVNLCFISETPFTSHIYKAIETKRKDHPTLNLYCEDHIYDIFHIDLFKQNMVPEQTIVDITDMLNRYNTTQHNLGVMSNKDAGAVWIGARPGMIVELKRLSDNTVYSYDYRLVKSKALKL
jgi:DNA-directed RNA polymerase subunit H (RpoH/RPB5)